MFFVDFSGGVLFDFHGLQINKLQLKKTRSRSTGFRILIRINRRCSGYSVWNPHFGHEQSQTSLVDQRDFGKSNGPMAVDGDVT